MSTEMKFYVTFNLDYRSMYIWITFSIMIAHTVIFVSLAQLENHKKNLRETEKVGNWNFSHFNHLCPS